MDQNTSYTKELNCVVFCSYNNNLSKVIEKQSL